MILLNKKTILLFLIIISAGFLSAQSLKDNPDYRMSVMLKKQSDKAFEDGDYTESTRLANESVLYAQKSDEWIAMMLSKYRANSALNRVRVRLQTVKKNNWDKNFPDAMEEGRTLYTQANDLYNNENFIDSYPIAVKAYETLEVIKYVKDLSPLPAAYVVMDIPNDEDCLWKIAEYEFIFGDAYKWDVIYQANKDILPESGNPDLIVPGLVLQIPSINGEERFGTWSNGSIN